MRVGDLQISSWQSYKNFVKIPLVRCDLTLAKLMNSLPPLTPEPANTMLSHTNGNHPPIPHEGHHEQLEDDPICIVGMGKLSSALR